MLKDVETPKRDVEAVPAIANNFVIARQLKRGTMGAFASERGGPHDDNGLLGILQCVNQRIGQALRQTPLPEIPQ